MWGSTILALRILDLGTHIPIVWESTGWGSTILALRLLDVDTHLPMILRQYTGFFNMHCLGNNTYKYILIQKI